METLSDMEVWMKQIVKYNEAYGSGSVATVSGWINALFPYVKNGRTPRRRNPWFAQPTTAIPLNKYPVYHASVPFKWSYHNLEFNMRAMVGHTVVGELKEANDLLPVGTLQIFPAWIILHMPDE